MILKNLLHNTKISLFQFIWISLIISFLLFFLNLLLWISYNTSIFSQDLKNKLWVYFYIKDTPEKKDEIYTKVINLKTKLEKDWLQVEFYSKEDALNLLQKRMPEIIKSFDKYWIENPLPPTLYVIFDNKEKYEILKASMQDYKDIVLNIEELNKWQSFVEQEKRISNIINLTNFTVLFSYFLIWILLVIIVSILMLIIKLSFYNLYNQIEIEKLLWAYYLQIKFPFYIQISSMLLTAFWLTIIYFSFFFNYLNEYLIKIFSVDLFDYIVSNSKLLVNITFIEIISITLLTLLISDIFLNKLLKKV